MIEANAEIVEERSALIAAAAQNEVKVLAEFRRTRAKLKATKTPMTGQQKSGSLDLLDDAIAATAAAVVARDEAFNATDPIIEE